MDRQNEPPESQSGPARKRAAVVLFVLAFLPLVLTRTPTTISEDLLILILLCAGIFGWRKRWRLPPVLGFLVEFLALGFLFAIVWRGQLSILPTWGRLAYWPVIALGAAAWCAGGAKDRTEGPLRLLPAALLIILVGLTLSQITLPATLPDLPYWYEQETVELEPYEELPIKPISAPLHWYRRGLLVAYGLIVAGLAALGVVLRSERYQEHRMSYLFLPLLFGSVAGAEGLCRDTAALAQWWQAGRCERSVLNWIGPEADTAGETRQRYARVLDTVEREGGYLLDKCSLDFVLRYRLAETAGRMHQPARMLRSLPPAKWATSSASTLIANLWTVEQLDRLRRKAEDPRYKLNLRSPRQRPWETASGMSLVTERLWYTPTVLEYHVDIYVDHETTADGSVVWLLDRWGRVFRSVSGAGLVPVWHSAEGEGRSDAVDLEVWDDVMVVAYRNGEVRSSTSSIAWLPKSWRMSLRPGHRLVDIERCPISDGAVALSSYGVFDTIGAVPEAFPIPKEPLFYWEAAVDFEFTRDALGWYVLDTYGVVHAGSGGQRPPMAKDVPDSPYWTLSAPYAPEFTLEHDALDIELDPVGRGVCLLNSRGELWTISDPPFREVFRPFPGEESLGLGVSLSVRQDGTALILQAPGNLVTVP